MPHYPKPFYRKSRGLWYVQIDGKQHNLGPDREDAFRQYRNLMAQPKEQRQVDPHSVASVVDLFLDWTQKHRAPRTYEWYLERTQAFLKTVPDLTVEQLKPFHLQQWVDSHPTWSDGHKRGCIMAVQRALRWALKMGHIEKNPIAYVEKPQAGKRDRTISAAEYKTILGHVDDEAFRDLLVTAWETGCRPQELLAVEARHVDLKHSRWIFPKEEAKGKKSVRIVYLTENALAITKRLMLKHPEGCLFRNTQGRCWTPYAVNCRFERLKQKLGTKYCLYTFRHSFATRMLQAGVDALTVSVLMGHADPSMLAKVYQHLSHSPEHLLNLIRKAAG